MITVVRMNSFFEIEKEWDKLYKKNLKLSSYQSICYMKELWKNLLLYRFILRVNPIFYLFKKDENVIFILPLYKKWFSNQYTLYGFKTGVGYLDAIYADEITIEDISRCFDALKRYIKNATIHFEHVKENTKLGQWIKGNGGKISVEGCTEIHLPDTYAEYYTSLSKHMKQNIRTAYNRLNKDGGIYKFEVISYPEMPKYISGELEHLYLERQILKYGKNVLYNPFVKYIDLGTKIHKSNSIDIKAYILYINNELAAYYDGILTDETIVIPRLAMADKFERYSPGIILINESAKFLIGRNVKVMDLTHGIEKYKLSMGGEIRHCVEMDLKLL